MIRFGDLIRLPTGERFRVLDVESADDGVYTLGGYKLLPPERAPILVLAVVVIRAADAEQLPDRSWPQQQS